MSAPGWRVRGKASERGFTFLELIIVLAIVSMLFAIGVPSFRNLAPKYRLRSAARGLGSTMESTRIAAMTRGLWMGVRYVLTPSTRDEIEGSFYQVIPPPPEDAPDQPVSERQLLAPVELPTGVRIASITLASGQRITEGSLNLLFSPMGNSGSHVVVLEGQEGLVLTLKMNAITGIIEFFDTAEVGFQNVEE